MEACATSHHWAREIEALGHSVRLMPPSYVKPYDADHWRTCLLRQNIQPVIPSRENRIQPHAFDRKRYKDRNGIERMFGRLKDYRRIAMRYDKNADNFMAGLCLAALICYWI